MAIDTYRLIKWNPVILSQEEAKAAANQAPTIVLEQRINTQGVTESWLMHVPGHSAVTAFGPLKDHTSVTLTQLLIHQYRQELVVSYPL